MGAALPAVLSAKMGSQTAVPPLFNSERRCFPTFTPRDEPKGASRGQNGLLTVPTRIPAVPPQAQSAEERTARGTGWGQQTRWCRRKR